MNITGLHCWRAMSFALALTVAGVVAWGSASAQQGASDGQPHSGDPWIDAALTDINRYGALYQATFTDELVRYHGAPRELVVELLRQRGWAPGDVYYACALAQVVGRPCRHVVEQWQQRSEEGWGALAESLGVAPNSAGAERLKQGVEASYQRWARPLDLVEQLRVEQLRAETAGRAVQRAGDPGDAPASGQEAGPPTGKVPTPGN